MPTDTKSVEDVIADVIEDHTWGTGHSSTDECWCGESFGNPMAHARHVAGAVVKALEAHRLTEYDPARCNCGEECSYNHLDDCACWPTS